MRTLLLAATAVLLSACQYGQESQQTEQDALTVAQARMDVGDREGAVQALEEGSGRTKPEAQIMLASLLLKKDQARAQRLLDSAEAQGSLRASYLAGYWELNRREGDSLRAMSRVTRAANGGDAAAQYLIHLAFRDGRHGKAANHDSALVWLNKAARSGDPFAQRDRRALDALPSADSARVGGPR